MTSQPPGRRAATNRANASCRSGTSMSTRRAWIRSKLRSGNASLPMSWRRTSRFGRSREASPARARIDICGDDLTVRADALCQPAGNGATARAHFETAPSGRHAGSVQIADGVSIEDLLYASDAKSGRLATADWKRIDSWPCSFPRTAASSPISGKGRPKVWARHNHRVRIVRGHDDSRFAAGDDCVRA